MTIFFSLVFICRGYDLDRTARSRPDSHHRFMEPARSCGKNLTIKISNWLASFVAGQTWVHAQQRMFVTVVRDFAGIEASRANIKDGRGVHLFMLLLNELLHLLYITAL